VERSIKEAILNGRLKAGDRLPTEKQMAAHLKEIDVHLKKMEEKKATHDQKGAGKNEYD